MFTHEAQWPAVMTQLGADRGSPTSVAACGGAAERSGNREAGYTHLEIHSTHLENMVAKQMESKWGFVKGLRLRLECLNLGL